MSLMESVVMKQDIVDDSIAGSRESEEEAASALTSLVSGSRKHEDADEDEGFEVPQRFTKSGRKRAVPFPIKLMKVLSNKEFSGIITWMPSGKSFSIVKPKAFVADILPEHFKSAKYSSFTRKLHRWGFMRHYRGEEAGAFYHKDFQRDRLDLVEQMSCYKTDPPKAPVAVARKVTQPAAQSAAPTEQPARIPAAPVLRETPVAQPPQIMAQLQQQQQPLKNSDLAAERLNAAIEAEVTRRLEERIKVAALSRLALPVMPLRQTPTQPRQQWNMAAGSLQAQLLKMQHQKQRLGMESSCIGLSAGMPRLGTGGLEELPRTNIQGAKTA